MRIVAYLFLAIAIGLSAFAAFKTAGVLADRIEERNARIATAALVAAGQNWAEIEADGTRISLSGTAPGEGARFRAIDVVRSIYDEDNVEESIVLADAEDLPPEPVRIELLLTPDQVTALGTRPVMLEGRLSEQLATLARPTMDLTRPVDTVVDVDWDSALPFLATLSDQITTGRVTLEDGTVHVEAALPDDASRADLRSFARSEVPPGLGLDLSLTSPRTILSPYPFVVETDAEGGVLRDCAAATADDAAQIERALAEVGVADPDCAIALGAPDAAWPDAVLAALATALTLPEAELTVHDWTVELLVSASLPVEDRLNLAEDLAAALPEGYEARVVQPATLGSQITPRAAVPPSPLVLTLTTETLDLSGAVASTGGPEAVTAYARTAFSDRDLTSNLESERIGQSTPVATAIAALDSLSLLNTGDARIVGDRLQLSGTGLGEDLPERIEALLEGLLPDMLLDLEIEGLPIPETPVVEGDTTLDAETCFDRLAEAQEEAPIGFSPASATLTLASAATIDTIAGILRECPDVRFEIGGHTDNQGGEELNRQISEARANSVLDALLARGVFLDRMTAIGYGESLPVASNETEEGRARNRRIEFTVLEIADAEGEDGTDPDDVAEGEANSEATEDEPAAEAEGTPDADVQSAGTPTEDTADTPRTDEAIIAEDAQAEGPFVAPDDASRPRSRPVIEAAAEEETEAEAETAPAEEAEPEPADDTETAPSDTAPEDEAADAPADDAETEDAAADDADTTPAADDQQETSQ
ncbi:OmpA family protein [Pontivivens ytuae]|uniref:OmpA family protein n=1 Tax=Pontivivens ytuae TaxID=2789856 RepID=A0A7S9LPA0_9RHOB|nr:OmpA family protein [Pontivivens ytuae]